MKDKGQLVVTTVLCLGLLCGGCGLGSTYSELAKQEAKIKHLEELDKQHQEAIARLTQIINTHQAAHNQQAVLDESFLRFMKTINAELQLRGQK